MLRRLSIAVLAFGFGAFAAQAQDFGKLATAVPAEVSEIATAGTWSEGAQTGVFRAIVLTTPAGKSTQAHLFVQLLALSEDGSEASVAKTVPIQKVSDKKLPNAFLAVEEDSTENEITWRLTSYNSATDTDTGVLVTVNAKGEAEVKDVPKLDDTPAEESGDKKE